MFFQKVSLVVSFAISSFTGAYAADRNTAGMVDQIATNVAVMLSKPIQLTYAANRYAISQHVSGNDLPYAVCLKRLSPSISVVQLKSAILAKGYLRTIYTDVFKIQSSNGDECAFTAGDVYYYVRDRVADLLMNHLDSNELNAIVSSDMMKDVAGMGDTCLGSGRQGCIGLVNEAIGTLKKHGVDTNDFAKAAEVMVRDFKGRLEPHHNVVNNIRHAAWKSMMLGDQKMANGFALVYEKIRADHRRAPEGADSGERASIRTFYVDQTTQYIPTFGKTFAKYILITSRLSQGPN